MASVASVTGGSLVGLVQQREQQNARKIEALTLRNDELSQSCRRLESERAMLLARLEGLEEHLAHAARDFAGYRRDNEARMASQDTRLAYLEQGAEERFVVLEEAAASLAQADQQSAKESAERERLIVHELEQLRAESEPLRAGLRLLADTVGGELLRSRCEAAHAEQQQRGGGQVPPRQPLTERHEELQRRCDALAEALRREQGHIEELRGVCGTVSEQGRRQDAAEDRIDRLDSTQRSAEAALEQCQQQQRAEAATTEGRLSASEGRLAALEQRLPEAARTAAEALERAEALGARVARVEGWDARVAELEIWRAEAAARIERMGDRSEETHGRLLQQEEMARKLSLDLQQLADEHAAAEERRSRREAEGAEQLAVAEARQRAELGELRSDIAAVRDRAPGVDEQRVHALCAELDRGRAVLASIAQLNDLRSREKEGEVGARLEALERAVLHPAPPPPLPAPYGPGGTAPIAPAALLSAAVAHGRVVPAAPSSSPPRRALTPTPVGLMLAAPGVMRSASVSPAAGPAHLSRSTSPRRGASPGLAAPLPPYRPLTGRGAPDGAAGDCGAAERSGSACSCPPRPPPPPPPPPPGAPRRVSPPAAAPAEHTALQRLAEDPARACSSSPSLPDPAGDRERGRQRMMDTLRQQLSGYEKLVSAASAAAGGGDSRGGEDAALRGGAKELLELRRAREGELERVNQQLSFIQHAFHALSEKEGALGESKAMFMEQLNADSSERADQLKSKLMRLVDDIRRSKHNVYERERALVDEGNRLRREIADIRERERRLSARERPAQEDAEAS